MDSLSDSYYGWTFWGRDNSDEAIKHFPREEVIRFSRLGNENGLNVIEYLSVPRFRFIDEIDLLKKSAEEKNDEELFRRLRVFDLLKREADYKLADLI